jgi:hypothetical protein
MCVMRMQPKQGSDTLIAAGAVQGHVLRMQPGEGGNARTGVATARPGCVRSSETNCSRLGQGAPSGRPANLTRGVCHSCFPGLACMCEHAGQT